MGMTLSHLIGSKKSHSPTTSGFEVIHAAWSVLRLLFEFWGHFLCFPQAIENDSQELELDLSSLNTINTVFAALFR